MPTLGQVRPFIKTISTTVRYCDSVKFDAVWERYTVSRGRHSGSIGDIQLARNPIKISSATEACHLRP